ncbi:MAG: bifunctional phosphopantothenoylcysteine decarboxylase/phosphopantothenate--cysteine ligase CoaBC [Campylobacteraceae bacterium]|nr:bifunctional phosphopantothenoylcysteine decarboxylase/phosphopantothenate--cysteine ligase CoaBC [Campylobacteraceae bacterium]
MIKNKNILIAVTGSIAIYKTLELIRLFIKAEANVKIIMSASAKKFITELTFETISQAKILDDTNENWDKDSLYNHISIGKWADILILAPASANTINKLKNGIADNILTQVCLAYKGNKILCPAANTNMIENPITKESLIFLENHSYKIVEPTSKELACRDIGKGAMADIEDIYYASVKELIKDDYWLNRDVIISGGGTIEKIDDVRYISNFSSGKMASSLALSLYLKGAKVKLVSTRGYENLPKEISIIKVSSSDEMYESLVSSLSSIRKNTNDKKAYLFMVAAISDYLPSLKEDGKLKKEDLGQTWTLNLKQNMDILSSLDKDEIISIGFKAETNEEIADINAKNMLKIKNLDAVCLNIINDNNNFGSDNNIIELFINNKCFVIQGSKLNVSFDLINKLKGEYNGKQ